MTTPADDEHTVIKSTPNAGGATRTSLPGESADTLPAATRLHEFEILSVIGQGGFGIVYLAHDLTLDRHVAIKEYMPSALATRTQAMTVAVRSSRYTETFVAGLRSFVNEARLLAQFDHPSLLKVHRFWEAHGTAYMVMPYYAGITFAKLLTQLRGPPDEARLRALLNPLLDALALMHAAHCYHRDIAPDNILILPDGMPLLLDFGAARRVIGDMTQALTVILKTGYAPVEQYGAMPDMSQGAWTDLYALGSVVEFAITGHTPPQAVARFLADKRQPLAVTAAGRYSDTFLRAIDRSLAVLPKDRPQSVAEMRALLAAPPARASLRNNQDDVTVPRVDVPFAPATAPAPTPAVRTPREPAPDAFALRVDATPRMRRRGIAIGSAVVVIALAALAGWRAWIATPRVPDSEPAASAPMAAQAPLPAPPGAASAAVTMEPPPVQVEQAPAPSPLPRVVPAHAETAPPITTPSAPEAAASAAIPMAEALRPPMHTSVRAPRAAAATPPGSQHIPNKKLPNARCADIIQRVSLGEPLSDIDKAILKRECEP